MTCAGPVLLPYHCGPADRIGRKGRRPSRPRASGSGALVAMTVGIQVTGLVTGMIVMFAGHLLLARLVPMTVRIEVSGLVAGMVVVLSGHLLLAGRVAMAVRVEIPGLVAGMVVVLSWLFLGHSFLLAVA